MVGTWLMPVAWGVACAPWALLHAGERHARQRHASFLQDVRCCMQRTQNTLSKQAHLDCGRLPPADGAGGVLPAVWALC
jgi:hypothetical protein